MDAKEKFSKEMKSATPASTGVRKRDGLRADRRKAEWSGGIKPAAATFPPAKAWSRAGPRLVRPLEAERGRACTGKDWRWHRWAREA